MAIRVLVPGASFAVNAARVFVAAIAAARVDVSGDRVGFAAVRYRLAAYAD